jgi:integrase/recombinase XerD
MYQTNCNEEAVIKIVGRLSQEFSEFMDLQKQISLRQLIDETLYKYEVLPKETALVASDIEEKMKIFFASKRLEGMSEKTVKNYNYILTKFATYLRKPLSSITTMDMRMYLAYVSKDVKASTTNALIYYFKSFFSWLTDSEYIIKNPMNKIKATKVPKRVRHALTEEEIELLRQACKTQREEALVEFAYSSGCRLSEIISINIEEIDWYDLSLFVIGKGNKERKVRFSIKAKILLQNYISIRKGSSEALFISSKAPYGRIGARAVEREVQNIAERAGFDKSVYPHLFRHSYATHKLNSGMSLPVLQHLMGHETPSTTQIYAVLNDENIRHEYNRTT